MFVGEALMNILPYVRRVPDDWLIFYVFLKRASVRGWRPPLVTFSENDQCRLNLSGDSAISILPNSIN